MVQLSKTMYRIISQWGQLSDNLQRRKLYFNTHTWSLQSVSFRALRHLGYAARESISIFQSIPSGAHGTAHITATLKREREGGGEVWRSCGSHILLKDKFPKAQLSSSKLYFLKFCHFPVVLQGEKKIKNAFNGWAWERHLCRPQQS